MSAMASQINSLTIVYSTLYSGADQRKHQSSASLAFVRGIQAEDTFLSTSYFSSRLMSEKPDEKGWFMDSYYPFSKFCLKKYPLSCHWKNTLFLLNGYEHGCTLWLRVGGRVKMMTFALQCWPLGITFSVIWIQIRLFPSGKYIWYFVCHEHPSLAKAWNGHPIGAMVSLSADKNACNATSS